MKISKLEKAKNSQEKGLVSKKTNNNTADRIDVSKLRYTYKFDGWIYYPNKEMGDFLYRVREDGTENTQLTDYSIYVIEGVSNGYLHFSDLNYDDRKIKLR